MSDTRSSIVTNVYSVVRTLDPHLFSPRLSINRAVHSAAAFSYPLLETVGARSDLHSVRCNILSMLIYTLCYKGFIVVSGGTAFKGHRPGTWIVVFERHLIITPLL